tara:strand:- start:3147 stop:3401 length:255 start_codon:yes stop_codon:yes gene_type:complete
MAKKLEKSELEYIKELLDGQSKNWLSIGQKYQQTKVLEAQMNNLVNNNLELDSDYRKNMEKIQNKYGKVVINIENGELTEEKDK